MRTVQLLLVLAAYLLVTAVLKDTLGLSQRICCGLAVGEQMHTFGLLSAFSCMLYTKRSRPLVQGRCTRAYIAYLGRQAPASHGKSAGSVFELIPIVARM